MTITEQIKEILSSINSQFGKLDGHQCSEFANALAALLYPLRTYEAEGEGECNKFMLNLMEEGDSKAKAEVKMKSDEVYQKYWNIRAMREGSEETIRTLKARIKVLQGELEI